MQNRAITGIPRSIADDRLRAAVRKLDDELGKQSRGPAVIAPRAFEPEIARIPAVAKECAACVWACLYHPRDIVRLIINALGKLAPTRREHIVADLLAVEAQFIRTQRRDVHCRSRERLPDHE